MDIKKIGFFLSFMNEGDAASWKEQLLEDAMATAQANNTELNLGLFAQFKHDLQEAFAPYNSPGDALKKMKTLRMKKDDSIDEHIAKFKMLATEAKVDITNPLAIELLKETLLDSLRMPLVTIDDWYNWAIKLDHRYHKMAQSFERTRGNMLKNKAPNRYYFL